MHVYPLVGLVEDDGVRNVLGSTHAGYPRRQIGDKDFALFVKAVAIAVPEAHDLIGIGHVHSPLVKGHAIGPQQIVGHRPHLVGAAIAVAVGQGHNAPGAVGVGHSTRCCLGCP